MESGSKCLASKALSVIVGCRLPAIFFQDASFTIIVGICLGGGEFESTLVLIVPMELLDVMNKAVELVREGGSFVSSSVAVFWVDDD